MRFLLTVLIVCTALSLCVPACATTYRITDLGTLGGTESCAYGINNDGWVAGSSKTPAGDSHAFLWKPGIGLSDLHSGTGTSSVAWAVNGNGLVTGSVGYTEGWSDAVVWSSGGSMTTLPKLAGQSTCWSEGSGINSQGQVAGFGWGRGVTWPPDAGCVSLGGWGFEASASDINDSGVIVGYDTVWRNDDWQAQAVYWQGGQIHYLPAFSESFAAYAQAVNNSNEIVGQAYRNGGYHPVLWTDPDTVLDLGTLGGVSGSAGGINDLSQVVGSSRIAGSGTLHAFIWDETTGIIDLNTLVDPSLGWTLANAYDINDDGWIVGSGMIGGQTHAFLLTPGVPEPGSLLALGSGLAGLLAFRRRNH